MSSNNGLSSKVWRSSATKNLLKFNASHMYPTLNELSMSVEHFRKYMTHRQEVGQMVWTCVESERNSGKHHPVV